MENYNHLKIERKWQRFWEKNGFFKARDFSRKPKQYILIEFPYPSADGLHVGHVRSYTALDAVARKKRMQGFNVLYPIGWDAFGLPTENYALKSGIHPSLVTKRNIKNFKRQLKSLGISFDWSREINTTDPHYYKWTQWIFLQFFKQGLAYKAKIAINWCPKCKIGLANEEVTNDRCERCGASVGKKMKEQWLLKITAYADRLIDDLEKVDYLEKIKTQQINWIGRSLGATMKFPIVIARLKAEAIPELVAKNHGIASVATPLLNDIEVFTTRPDTISGATYLVLAPEHEIISNIKYQISNIKEVENYIARAKNKSEIERTGLEKEKTGVELKGIKAVNSVNNKEIPIWVADYVSAEYGTGAIMAVPAHDERDFEFAKKFGLPIIEVVKPQTTEIKNCLIIHGSPSHDPRQDPNYEERSKRRWIPWLRERLEEKGIRAYTPQMPVPWEPKYEDWKKIVENLDVGEKSVLVGHSAGGAFLVRWLGEKKIKVKKLILVAPTKISKVGDHRLDDLYNFEIDPVVKNLAGEIVIFVSNDKERRRKAAKIYQKALEAQFIELENKGHFTFKDMGTREFPELLERILENKLPYLDDGISVNSVFLNGLPTSEAKKKIVKWLEKKHLGKRAVSYKLRDWVFSRQRYWGEPIPLIFCRNCKKLVENSKLQTPNSKLQFTKGELLNPGWIAISEKDLPVKLPYVKQYEPTETGESPLAKIEKWVKTKCPKCGGLAVRETDTMPTWAGSSWYYLAYIMRGNLRFKIQDSRLFRYWLPVDLYNGGMEHTTLHLLYSRFWHKFLHSLKIVPTIEPYLKRRSHGMVLASDSRKMSKSFGNVVNPDEIVKKYGADTLRIYEMFMGPFKDAIPWDGKGVIGIRRFLERVWRLQYKVKDESKKFSSNKAESKDDLELEKLVHQTIKKVSLDLEAMKFNTTISTLMILSNHLSKYEKIFLKHYSLFLILLIPFAPHLAEELWQRIGNKHSIHLEKWPQFDSRLIKEETIKLVIEVNGKVREVWEVASGLSEKEIKKLALEREKVKKWISGKEVKKIIFVKDKLVNIVV